MRKIEFIAPVEAMRGNLSGKQRLLYADNNNPAWDAPNGKQYARNYRTSYIGNKTMKTGNVHFAVRQRSAVTLSVQSRHAMALLAAANGIYPALSVNLTLIASLMACYNASSEKAEGKSVGSYVYSKVYPQMLRGQKQLGFYERANGQTISCTFLNPFTDPLKSGMLQIIAGDYSTDTLLKFWDQMAVHGGKLKVEGLEAIYFIGWTWEDLANDEFGYNVLGFSEATVGANTFIKLGDMWLMVSDDDDPAVEYVNITSLIETAGKTYTLSSEAPTA